jgi:IS5 family transposase
MRSEGHLGRSYLKGRLGDAINALMAGAGQNLRMILKKLRLLLASLMEVLLTLVTMRHKYAAQIT